MELGHLEDDEDRLGEAEMVEEMLPLGVEEGLREVERVKLPLPVTLAHGEEKGLVEGERVEELQRELECVALLLLVGDCVLQGEGAERQ